MAVMISMTMLVMIGVVIASPQEMAHRLENIANFHLQSMEKSLISVLREGDKIGGVQHNLTVPTMFKQINGVFVMIAAQKDISMRYFT